MKLKTFLLNTASHEIINKVSGLYDDARMRAEPSFVANMAKFQAERYRMILRSTPGKLRYTG